MNITLKSLLISSALTLPSVFGSADDLLTPESTAHPAAAAAASTPAATSQWDAVIALFESHPSGSFEELVNSVIESPLLSGITEERVLRLCIAMDERTRLNFQEKGVLRDILLNPNRAIGVLEAANRLYNYLGSEYHDLTARLYQRSSLMSTATQESIQAAVRGLFNFGPEYHELTARLCQHSATLETATSKDILSAVNNLHRLANWHPADSEPRSRYTAMADTLLEHPKVTEEDLQEEAQTCRDQADNYEEGGRIWLEYMDAAKAFEVQQRKRTGQKST